MSSENQNSIATFNNLPINTISFEIKKNVIIDKKISLEEKVRLSEINMLNKLEEMTKVDNKRIELRKQMDELDEEANRKFNEWEQASKKHDYYFFQTHSGKIRLLEIKIERLEKHLTSWQNKETDSKNYHIQFRREEKRNAKIRYYKTQISRNKIKLEKLKNDGLQKR